MPWKGSECGRNYGNEYLQATIPNIQGVSGGILNILGGGSMGEEMGV